MTPAGGLEKGATIASLTGVGSATLNSYCIEVEGINDLLGRLDALDIASRG
jgi:hypothetical protein